MIKMKATLAVSMFLFICVFSCKRTKEASENGNIILYKVAVFAYKTDTLKSTFPPGYQYPLKFYFEISGKKNGKMKANAPDSLFSTSKPSHLFYSILDGDTLELMQAYKGSLVKPENKGKFALCITFSELKESFDSTKYINYKMYMEDIINRSEIYYIKERIKKKDVETMYLDLNETYVN